MTTTILNIVFQSGDFYNEDTSNWWLDLVNTIIGVFIGSGVTIWALYRTFKHDKQKEEANRIQFQKEKIKYLGAIIRDILKDLKFQIDSFTKFSLTIKGNPLDIPLLSRVPMNDLERVVHKLDQENYFHSYLGVFNNTKEIEDEFRTIMKLLNYFDGNMSIINASLEKAQNFDYERKTRLKNLTEKAMDDAAGLLVNNDILENKKDFWGFINDTIVNFHNKKREGAKEDADLKFYFDNFINVIKFGLIDFYKTIPTAHYLLVQLKQATFIYSDIQVQNDFLAGEFADYYKSMNEQYEKLVKAAKRLTEYNG